MDNPAAAIGLLVALALIALLAWFGWRAYRRQSLRHRYGPEYARAVHEFGSDDRAASELAQREERIRKYHIRALSRREQEDFALNWRNTQAGFVDDPRSSVREADALVCRLMETRGYPMADFDRRAEDLSVDFPKVVDNYRAAHRIALADAAGKANTEDLRRAFMCYRELFADLLDTGTPATRREVHA